MTTRSVVFMRTLQVALLVLPLSFAHAAEPCRVIHGRAHFYSGDGQLRIWHVGTHHEYEPDESSWERVIDWLQAGVPEPARDMPVRRR